MHRDGAFGAFCLVRNQDGQSRPGSPPHVEATALNEPLEDAAPLGLHFVVEPQVGQGPLLVPGVIISVIVVVVNGSLALS